MRAISAHCPKSRNSRAGPVGFYSKRTSASHPSAHLRQRATAGACGDFPKPPLGTAAAHRRGMCFLTKTWKYHTRAEKRNIPRARERYAGATNGWKSSCGRSLPERLTFPVTLGLAFAQLCLGAAALASSLWRTTTDHARKALLSKYSIVVVS